MSAVAADPGLGVEEAGAASAVLRVDDVRLVYPRGVRALDGVTAGFEGGRHTVIVGASGSGKTTLLGCLSGRLVPTSGAVARRGVIATIYQDLRLVPERSVLGNVMDGALGRRPAAAGRRAWSSAARAEAMGLLARVGLSERARHPVARLSGGERQRVAIARALMQHPDVLLADEPVCSLDRANAARVMSLLVALCRERGVTLVSVLHDDRLAAEFGDRVLTLSRGRVVGSGGEGGGFGGAVSGTRLIELPQVPRGGGGAPVCGACAGIDPGAACCCAGAGGVGGSCDSARDASGDPSCDPSCGVRDAARRPAWMHPGALLAIGLAVIAVYAWSSVSLGLHEAGGRGVVRGVWRFLTALVPTSFEQLASIPWGSIAASLVETLQMSLIGTTAGVALAYPAAALAARNTGPGWLRGPVRQALNAARTVPSLVWALLFVAAVGLGPTAGVLALSVYSVGYLSKFFYESFEHAPKGPQEALREIGATGPQRFWRAVAPATRPAAVASCLFMLEYNVRAASVLGVVDAGGIGYYLKFYLELRNFPAALACLALVFGVVVVLDMVSARVRRALTPV